MGLSVEAKARIAELWAAGAPAWKIREEAGVSRHAKDYRHGSGYSFADRTINAQSPMKATESSRRWRSQ